MVSVDGLMCCWCANILGTIVSAGIVHWDMMPLFLSGVSCW